MYTELHLHDYYSTLDGLNSPAEYMVRAKELGMTHLAQTNHGTLSGHREFQIAAKNAGITPILGVEAYVSPTDRFDRRTKAKRTDGTSVYNHMIILAQGETGLSTLNTLNRLAWETGFYNKPRIDLDLLEEHNEGLIVLSGCLNGLLAKAIERDDMDTAMRTAHRLKTMLPGRFYIELQGHNPEKTNAGLIEIGRAMKIPCVVTSDCHYARKEDLWIEEAMLILSTSPKVNFEADFNKSQKMEILERFNYLYPDRMMSFQEIEIYLHSAEEHLKQWAAMPEVLSNTMEIANSIGEYPFHEALDLLPRPRNADPHELLRKKAEFGLAQRGMDDKPEYVARLNDELKIIMDKDFSTYFLIVHDMVDWAKSQDIMVGPGRGSAAGSLVCYALGITNVDPIHYGLLFFRFIDPSRDDFPDIDTDFEDRRRGEVKDYLRRKFKNVASIATYSEFVGKGTVRDAARVFRVPMNDVNKALKGIDAPPTVDWFPLFEESDKGKEFIKKYPEVWSLSKELKGRIRGSGMHAAGIVIAKDDLSKYAPLETAKDPNDPSGDRVPMVAMDMNMCADVGLIKLDALGLKALAILTDTIKFVKEKNGLDIDLDKINLEDRKVYAMLSDGYTKGVFQCEQPSYTSLIIKMGGVWSFAELAASNALVRPGAANTIGPDYIARKNGQQVVEYKHKDMESFTKDTYGEILYQEQVMLTMTEIAGMTMSDANKVRKLIGKKKDRSEFEPFRLAFVDGASKKIKKKQAEKLWEDFLAHADYSFNKSHAVAYSLLSYWTAYLKFHYPKEFMCAALRNEGDKDARTDYLIEAKRLNLKVLLPHVDASEMHFSIEPNGIRFGLSNIKYISTNLGGKLMDYRPFNTYAALEEKVLEKGSGLSTRVLGALNAVGGAAFPDHPRTGNERDNFYEYLSIPAFEQKSLPPKVKMQFQTLDEYEESGVFSIMAMARKIKRGTGWSRIEVVDETGTAGIFHDENTMIETGQMYAMLVAENRIARYIPVGEVTKESKNSYCQFLFTNEIPELTDNFYKIVAFQSHTTQKGKRMAYVVISDAEKNMMRVMAFPQLFVAAYSKCQEGAIVGMDLKQTDDGSVFVDKFY